jgi:hypothetical protein
MPKVLRKVGQWAGKLRRMAADLRSQSGIDDALRLEGLHEDIAEIRKLARGELDGVERSIRGVNSSPEERESQAREMRKIEDALFRTREYPRDGADSYGAIPDAAYIDYPLPPSPFARDALYMTGDPNGELPPEPEPASTTAPAEVVAPESPAEASAENPADAEAQAPSAKPSEADEVQQPPAASHDGALVVDDLRIAPRDAVPGTSARGARTLDGQANDGDAS